MITTSAVGPTLQSSLSNHSYTDVIKHVLLALRISCRGVNVWTSLLVLFT